MDDLRIRALGRDDAVPYDLLLSADPNRALVDAYLKRGTTFVAETAEGKIIGVYVLIETRPDTMELVNVAVADAYQGRGIGKRLVLHAIEAARSAGVKTLEVGTGSTGVTQLALYQKCGFRMVGIDRDFFVRHYDEPIYENGMQLFDMVRLAIDL
ncbi:MAG TPA: GNAT family N-acetyltransferase [Paenibacillus sp.]|nr:GNAT family N-acetyltransferase [Paenibacillus sp.]